MVQANAPGSVCSSGIYSDLSGLSAFPPAEAFCSTHFPQVKYTTTVTVTGQPTLPTKNAATTAVKPRSGILTEAELPLLFAKLELLADEFVSTACSCIETPSTVTVRSPDPEIQRNLISIIFRLLVQFLARPLQQAPQPNQRARVRRRLQH